MKSDKHLDWFRMNSRLKKKKEVIKIMDEDGISRPKLKATSDQKAQDIRQQIDEFFRKSSIPDDYFERDQLFRDVPNPGYGKFAEDDGQKTMCLMMG